MKVKRYLVIVLSFAFSLTIFVNCHSYDYDEGLNGMLTPERRLIGTWEMWELEQYTVTDGTVYYYPRDNGDSHVLEFNKHNIGYERLSYSSGAEEFQLEWKLNESKNTLSMRYKNGSGFDEWTDWEIDDLDRNNLVLWGFSDDRVNYVRIAFEKKEN